jgi:hypothetical protein
LVLVQKDGKAEVVEPYGFFHAVGNGREGKLGRVDRNNDQTPRSVFSVEVIEMGKGPDAVDACVVPEIEEDHLAREIGGWNRTLRSNPASIAFEGRGLGPGVSGKGKKEQKQEKGGSLLHQKPESLSHHTQPLNRPALCRVQ